MNNLVLFIRFVSFVLFVPSVLFSEELNIIRTNGTNGTLRTN